MYTMVTRSLFFPLFVLAHWREGYEQGINHTVRAIDRRLFITIVISPLSTTPGAFVALPHFHASFFTLLLFVFAQA